MNQFYKAILLLAILFCAQTGVLAQVWTKVSAYREPAEFSAAATIVHTADGYYETGIYSNSLPTAPPTPSRGDRDVYVRKVGMDGREQWVKTFGGSDYDNQQIAIALPDGGLLLGINYYSPKLDIGGGDTLSGNLPTLPSWMNPFSAAFIWLRPDGSIRKAITTSEGPISISPNGPKVLTHPSNHLYVKLEADTNYHPRIGGIQLGVAPYLPENTSRTEEWRLLIDSSGTVIRAAHEDEKGFRVEGTSVFPGTYTNTISFNDTSQATLRMVKRIRDFNTPAVLDSLVQEQYAWVVTGLNGGFARLIPTGLIGYRQGGSFRQGQTPLVRLPDGSIALAFEASSFGIVTAAGDTLRDSTWLNNPPATRPDYLKVHAMVFNPDGSPRITRILSVEGDTALLAPWSIVFETVSQPTPGQYQFWLNLRGSTRVDGLPVQAVPQEYGAWIAGLKMDAAGRSTSIAYAAINRRMDLDLLNRDLMSFSIGNGQTRLITGPLMPSPFFHYKVMAGGQEARASGRPFPHFVLDVADTTLVSLVTGQIMTGNGSCSPDTSLPANPFSASVVLEPGGTLIPTDPEGRFTVPVSDTGSYTLRQVLPGASVIGTVSQACPTANAGFQVRVTGMGQRLGGFVFYNKPDTLCRALSVDVVQGRTRRCFKSTSVITVSNDGLLPAQGVNLVLETSSAIRPLTASMTPVMVNDSVRQWTIGNLAPGQKMEIQVTDSIACRQGLTGRTICMKASLQPGDTCLPAAAGWDGAELAVDATCMQPHTNFVVSNLGRNMADSTKWRLIIDSAVVQTGMLKLPAGASTQIQVTSQGSLTRLEVDRTPGHPWGGYTSAISEFCGLTSPPNTRTGIQNFSPDEASASYEEHCAEVVDSYDPNDKQAIPAGVGSERTILFKDWIEYTIRFENMGTDTAFTVEIRDTLDPALDLGTVRFGAMSHKFETRLEGTTGQPVLVWKNTRTNLLWTSRYPNQSGGFVKFKARAKDGLAEGTPLRNEASIVFDYNAPVVTNSVGHTLRSSLPSGPAPGGVSVVVGPVGASQMLQKGSLVVSPNPVSHQVKLDAGTSAGWVEVYSSDGRKLLTRRIPGGSPITLDRPIKSSGWVFVRWKPDTGGAATHKLLWE